MSNRFAVKRLDTQHQQLPIHRFIRPLRVAIAIERHFLAGDAKLRGPQGPVRFDDDVSQLLLQSPYVGALWRGPVVELDYRPVVRVRADDEEVFDAGSSFHALANGGHALARGRPADVETHDRHGFLASL